MKTSTKNKDMYELQTIMHYYGCDEFLKMIKEALYCASDDIEHINIQLSEQYRDRATRLSDMLDEALEIDETTHKKCLLKRSVK
jgi:hypothetical protein